MQHYLNAFRLYAVWDGRSNRADYWYFQLFTAIVVILCGLLHLSLISLLYGLFTILPSLALTVRRLHDTDRSGWWMFIVLIPIIGNLILFVWMVSSGVPGPNRYGSTPS